MSVHVNQLELLVEGEGVGEWDEGGGVQPNGLWFDDRVSRRSFPRPSLRSSHPVRVRVKVGFKVRVRVRVG